MHGFYSFWDGPGLRAGVGAADFLHVRHPIPQSRFASVGGYEPRPRSWPWSWRWQIREARQHVCSVGAGRGTPAAGTGCWQTGMARSVPVRRDPGACLPDKAGVCLSGSRGGQSDADTGVGRPESGGADECRDAFGLPACLPGNAGACHPNRVVGLPERDACCGCGRSAVLARKNEGSPERLPSPSKINP